MTLSLCLMMKFLNGQKQAIVWMECVAQVIDEIQLINEQMKIQLYMLSSYMTKRVYNQ